ncbi:helix-turn-helix domain-containing protein [Streptomyces sp. N2A]|uniref:PucR family transcriptional regulator n=1 Tax=Streptomyces sp. N2A TaxID=3073936 RepID=UPI0028703A98|nr:helix-turn-helix domain-containing protein [Streptomyces sp. N2A]
MPPPVPPPSAQAPQPPSGPPSTTAPSTPPVPLAALLARADLGLRQLAGPREGVTLHWVHTSEMADPVPYLLGGELLLTAGVHLAEVTAGAAGEDADAALASYLDGYAARTVAAGAAALGFGIAPVHEAVPPALVEACDRHGLPLVEVPAGTPFTAVESAVWQAVTKARHRELSRIGEAQRALAAAAARPDPAGAVLRALARHVHGWTALLGPDGTEHGSAGARPTDRVRAAAERLAQVVGGGAVGGGVVGGGAVGGGEVAGPGGREAGPGGGVRAAGGGPSSATDTLPGTQLSAYALTGRAAGREACALVVAADPDDPPAHTIAGVAAVLLSLITGPAAARGAADTGHSAALAHLLLGARPADVGPLLGAPLWTVVHAERRGGAAAPEADAAALAAALGTALVAPEPVREPAREPASEPARRLRALVPADREIGAQPGWTLGVSAPAPVEELPAADRHAATALRRALAHRTALVRRPSPDRPGLTALVDPDDAQRHAQALLAPLAASPALVTTLHTWLSLHGSWDRTATALGIHRNTVRQRIARTATLLDTDLDDTDVRMELWFALRCLDRAGTEASDAGRPGRR